MQRPVRRMLFRDSDNKEGMLFVRNAPLASVTRLRVDHDKVDVLIQNLGF